MYVAVAVAAAGVGGRRLVASLVSVGLADGEAVVHVLAVGARVRELLEALAALVGLLPRVQPLVLRQVVLVLEGLRALHALVRTLPCDTNTNVTFLTAQLKPELLCRMMMSI